MYKYHIEMLREKKIIHHLPNKIKQMVNKKQFSEYYWFVRYSYGYNLICHFRCGKVNKEIFFLCCC